MFLHQEVPAISGVAGLFVGAAIAYVAPRLVAYRLSEPTPFPPAPVLVPVFGVLITGWRPIRTVALELVTAAVFVALAVHFGVRRELGLAAAYSAILIAIAVIDLDHRLVLNRLSYPAALVGLVGAVFWPGIGALSALIGAVTALLIFGAFEFLGRGALGSGDTKLAIAIGAMRGFPGVFNALLFGMAMGGIGAAIVLLVLRRGRKDYIAYAPFLSAGAILSLFLTGS